MGRGSKRWLLAAVLLAALLAAGGCSVSAAKELPGKEPEGKELVYEGSLTLSYAENFQVDYYQGGYRMVTVMDRDRFLVVPEGKKVPEGFSEEIQVLQQPLGGIYLAATAAMDMFCQLDALETITFSGQKQEGWHLEEAKEAMAEGRLLYAGKYSQPDYELLLSRGCCLAIENTMITHSPQVPEKLREFGIPVLTEYSSYESHPLGRVEWIKLYGALLGKEKEAEESFRQQEEILEQVTAREKTGKTVAFFFITTDGMVQVRQASDYIPKMIELAGGSYLFDSLGEEDSNRSTRNIQMEEFYQTAKEADFLIYNSTIDGGVSSLEELFEKSGLLRDFTAVQQGNVWCTANDMYQQSMSIGYMIEDIHRMLTGGEKEKMHYLFPLE